LDNSTKIIHDWFADCRHVLVLGRGPSATDPAIQHDQFDAVVVLDPTYARRDVYADNPTAVLIGDTSVCVGEAARRYFDAPTELRPLLMHGYVAPQLPDFAACGLEPPVSVRPLLADVGYFGLAQQAVYPTSGVFLAMTMAALDLHVTVAGIDLYRHPSGQMYVNEQPVASDFKLPEQHSEQCDIEHLQRIAQKAGDRVRFLGVAGEVIHG